MVRQIDPKALQGLPLTARRIGLDDYEIAVGGLAAGRIMAKTMSGDLRVWFWTLTGPALPAELQPSAGEEPNLDAAKAALKAKFQAWSAWASGRSSVHWHG